MLKHKRARPSTFTFSWCSLVRNWECSFCFSFFFSRIKLLFNFRVFFHSFQFQFTFNSASLQLLFARTREIKIIIFFLFVILLCYSTCCCLFVCFSSSICVFLSCVVVGMGILWVFRHCKKCGNYTVAIGRGVTWIFIKQISIFISLFLLDSRSLFFSVSNFSLFLLKFYYFVYDDLASCIRCFRKKKIKSRFTAMSVAMYHFTLVLWISKTLLFKWT